MNGEHTFLLIIARRTEQRFCSVDCHDPCGFLEDLFFFFFFPQHRPFVSLSASPSISIQCTFAHFAFIFPMYHFSMYFIHCLGLISDWQAHPHCLVYHLEIQLKHLHSSILFGTCFVFQDLLQIHINGKARSASHSFKTLEWQLSVSMYFKNSSFCNCCLLSSFVTLKFKIIYSLCLWSKKICFIFIIFNSGISFSSYDIAI